jgi:soluble lytic murein transglycosylase-like protein
MMLLRVLLLAVLSVALLAFAVGMRPLRTHVALAASENSSSRFEDRFPTDADAKISPDLGQTLRNEMPAPDSELTQSSSASVSVDKKLTTGGAGLYVSALPLEKFLARTEGGVQRWSGIVMQAADANGLPRQFFLKLISQESGFKPTSISRAGALGIAQFMPATAIAVGLKDPFEPVSAINASAAHLATLLKRFGNLGLAAAAYNAGPERVSAWLSGKRGLPAETRNYVRQVTGLDAESWMGPRAGLIGVSNVAAVGKSGKSGSGSSAHKPSSPRSASAINLCQAINSTGTVCRVQTSY